MKAKGSNDSNRGDVSRGAGGNEEDCGGSCGLTSQVGEFSFVEMTFSIVSEGFSPLDLITSTSTGSFRA